ncbi:MAG: hypothetical protein QM756_07035 [Polyangiaceae bacterium]
MAIAMTSPRVAWLRELDVPRDAWGGVDAVLAAAFQQQSVAPHPHDSHPTEQRVLLSLAI